MVLTKYPVTSGMSGMALPKYPGKSGVSGKLPSIYPSISGVPGKLPPKYPVMSDMLGTSNSEYPSMSDMSGMALPNYPGTPVALAIHLQIPEGSKGAPSIPPPVRISASRSATRNVGYVRYSLSRIPMSGMRLPRYPGTSGMPGKLPSKCLGTSDMSDMAPGYVGYAG